MQSTVKANAIHPPPLHFHITCIPSPLFIPCHLPIFIWKAAVPPLNFNIILLQPLTSTTHNSTPPHTPLSASSWATLAFRALQSHSSFTFLQATLSNMHFTCASDSSLTKPIHLPMHASHPASPATLHCLQHDLPQQSAFIYPTCQYLIPKLHTPHTCLPHHW